MIPSGRSKFGTLRLDLLNQLMEQRPGLIEAVEPLLILRPKFCEMLELVLSRRTQFETLRLDLLNQLMEQRPSLF